MNRRFLHSVTFVTIVHGLVIGMLLVVSGCHSLFSRRKELYIPVEFTVEVPRGPDTTRAKLPEEPTEVAEPDEPEPAPEVTVAAPTVRKTDTAKPKPVAEKPKTAAEKPKTTKVVPSTKLVKRTHPGGSTRKPPLTAAEIERLLAQGARPSDHTSIPGEDDRCRELIRMRLYDAWTQPGGTRADGRVAEVTLELGSGGLVRNWRMTSRSGSAEFDASVEAAMRSVARIEHLTPEFVERNPRVTIAFELE